MIKLTMKVVIALILASLLSAFLVVLLSIAVAAVIKSQSPVQTYAAAVSFLMPIVYAGYAYFYQRCLRLFRVRVRFIHAIMALFSSTVAYVGGVGLLFFIDQRDWVAIPAISSIAIAAVVTIWFLKREESKEIVANETAPATDRDVLDMLMSKSKKKN